MAKVNDADDDRCETPFAAEATDVARGRKGGRETVGQTAEESAAAGCEVLSPQTARRALRRRLQQTRSKRMRIQGCEVQMVLFECPWH